MDIEHLQVEDNYEDLTRRLKLYKQVQPEKCFFSRLFNTEIRIRSISTISGKTCNNLQLQYLANCIKKGMFGD
jgi:hypothetical protein